MLSSITLTVPTFRPGDLPLRAYFLIQGLAFLATIPYASFFEWLLHRNIMHRKTWISYPFELHAVLHHRIFRHDETYHAQDDEMRRHVTFVPRDYILLLLVNTPVFLGIELAFHIPVMLGGWLACLAYLAAFDLLHWSFHVPDRSRVHMWGWVQWLKEHHRLHHRYQNRNLNVVLPLADFVLGTRVSKAHDSPEATAPAPNP